MIKYFVYSILFLVLVISSSLYWKFGQKENYRCKNLHDISLKQKVIDNLWDVINTHIEETTELDGSPVNQGVVLAKHLDRAFNVNWEQLGIPLFLASVELTGSGVDYRQINWENVESIKLGYRHRDRLVFQLNNHHNGRKSLSVVCR